MTAGQSSLLAFLPGPARGWTWGREFSVTPLYPLPLPCRGNGTRPWSCSVKDQGLPDNPVSTSNSLCPYGSSALLLPTQCPCHWHEYLCFLDKELRRREAKGLILCCRQQAELGSELEFPDFSLSSSAPFPTRTGTFILLLFF